MQGEFVESYLLQTLPYIFLQLISKYEIQNNLIIYFLCAKRLKFVFALDKKGMKGKNIGRNAFKPAYYIKKYYSNYTHKKLKHLIKRDEVQNSKEKVRNKWSDEKFW